MPETFLDAFANTFVVDLVAFDEGIVFLELGVIMTSTSTKKKQKEPYKRSPKIACLHARLILQRLFTHT
jgi:hypothetical protein